MSPYDRSPQDSYGREGDDFQMTVRTAAVADDASRQELETRLGRLRAQLRSTKESIGTNISDAGSWLGDCLWWMRSAGKSALVPLIVTGILASVIAPSAIKVAKDKAKHKAEKAAERMAELEAARKEGRDGGFREGGYHVWGMCMSQCPSCAACETQPPTVTVTESQPRTPTATQALAEMVGRSLETEDDGSHPPIPDVDAVVSAFEVTLGLTHEQAEWAVRRVLTDLKTAFDKMEAAATTAMSAPTGSTPSMKSNAS